MRKGLLKKGASDTESVGDVSNVNLLNANYFFLALVSLF